jgi:acyl transferase domain-containing protein/NAD(P)-dependent dehydrogenase (short-subunit alcohol dehydrogenase family)/acyl carrier protein/SAM-dependent methyltransferase
MTQPVVNARERLRRYRSDPLVLVAPAGATLSQWAVDPDLLARCAEQTAQAKAMNALILRTLHAQLRQAGALDSRSRPTASAQAALDPAFARWLESALRMLVDAGLATESTDGTRSIVPTEHADELQRQWERGRQEWVWLRPHAALAQSALEPLPEILRGHRSATEILFPNGSFARVEGVYSGNPAADVFNHYVAQAVRAAAQATRAAGRRLRVLEIGAGTGGSSRVVFEALSELADAVQDYCYTDISKAFLLHAHAHYRARIPYLSTALFDVERDFVAQSLEGGGYDVIVATNVLHATRNIRQTLRNAKGLLRHNGMLVLNEVYGNGTAFTHVTFGLTPGWWRYEDPALRAAGGPGLLPRGWHTVLRDEGFTAVSFPAESQYSLGSQVVLAQSDGLVRVAAQSSPASAPLPAEPAVIRGSDALPIADTSAGSDDVETVHEVVLDELRHCLMLNAPPAGDASFADLGLDSIVGMSFITRLNERLGVKLDHTATFDHPTARKLGGHIVAAHEPKLMQGSDTQAGSAPPAAVMAPAIAGQPLRSTAVGGETSSARIAIIGMSGVFAGSPDLNALWHNLANGADLVVPFPDRGAAGQARAGSPVLGGFLERVDEFDALFFSISGQEATYMDPQQRLFLQECWRALEDAGHAGGDLANLTCGVYVGGSGGDYTQLFGDNCPSQALWGNFVSLIAARISYFLDLRGPALVIDTACSSSLVALHLACQALSTREVDAAIAGGVFVLSTPKYFIELRRAGMFSPSGRCHAFDARADGFVPAEGAGAVLLKRLDDAVAAGDHVYAVIRGSGVNQDGASNGITAPSAASQEQLELSVYRACGLNARQVQLVEAHGTGTVLGDPIEHTALSRAFRRYTQDTGFCALGTIKTNFGHAQSAAGIAGVLKVVLALRARKIPPNLHFISSNPKIDLAHSPFYVNTVLREWPPNRGGAGQPVPRCGVVSSFGISGTNAHVVIEEAPVPPAVAGVGPSVHLLALSARTPPELRESAERLLRHFEEHSELDLAAASCTLLIGRRHFNQRLALLARDLTEAIARLRGFLRGDSGDGVFATLNESPRRRGPMQRPSAGPLEGARTERDPQRLAGHLQALAIQFVHGHSIDFGALFEAGRARRVPLPTYPLARDRYWASEIAANLRVDSDPAVEPSARAGTRLEAAAPAQAIVPSASDEIKATTLTASAQLTTGWLRMRADWFEAQASVTLPDPEVKVVLAAGLDASAAQELQASLPQETRFDFVPGLDAAAFLMACDRLLHDCKQVFREQPPGNVRVQVLVCGEAGEAFASGLAGFLKSAQREYPQLRGQVIELPAVASRIAFTTLEQNLADESQQVRYTKDGARRVRRLVELAPPPTVERRGWTEGGITLITGGGGEIGLQIAEALAQSVSRGRIVLTGRSPPDPVRAVRIARLARGRCEIEYRAVAVHDRDAMTALITELARSGAPLGIVHAAGVLHDSYLLHKSSADLADVLKPKVLGAELLDELTLGMPVEFFLLFSSIAGEFGNVGQADYAAANAWLDGFAERRSARVARGERHGVTRSIGWSVWESGGMQPNAVKETQLRQRGLVRLATKVGLGLLDESRAWPVPHVVALHGDVAHLRAQFAVAPVSSPSAPPREVTAVNTYTLQPLVEQRLIELFAAVTLLPAQRIDVAEPLASYGIDSLMVTQLNAQLESALGELPKTLFFEHHTLESLAGWLCRRHPGVCSQWCEIVQPQTTALSLRTTPLPLPTTQASGLATAALASPAGLREPIAIIGLSGRYPGAPDLASFWRNLCDGADAIGEMPADRWPVQRYLQRDVELAIEQGRYYTTRGAFLEDCADFDPLFFNLAPADAYNLNPQERLFIESCWSTLEDAAYTRERLARQHRSRVGVFAGITKTGYELYGPALWSRGLKAYPHTSFGSVANRVSYLLNLSGPSMPIDTMCSASLTAIHEACESLRRDECELALAGGVNLYLHPSNQITLCAQRMLSPSGRCRPFAAGGDGFVPGEGVGTLLLKPLSAAQRDGDPIRALIIGSAVNHGGKTSGYTVPNPVAQAQLIRAAMRSAGVSAREVSYVEAHGTGTSLGDPIEVAGLQDAFSADTADTGFCALGSVKSNIGHLEAAAGIAGLTKIVLQMQHGELVPTLHARVSNPAIDFARGAFQLQQTRTPWSRPRLPGVGERPRIAGISSFGAGGSNAHVVLREYVSDAPVPPPDGGSHCIVLSARNADRLQEVIRRLVDLLPQLREQDLPALACTLQVGREAMEERLALHVHSLAHLRERLTRHLEGERVPGVYTGRVQRERDALALFDSDEELRAAVAGWICKGKLDRLLLLWVKGMAVDWQAAYPQRPLRCISLPGYPFARERYWIAPQFIHDPASVGALASTHLHPLLHENVSTFGQQRFRSRFDGEESFFTDHQIHGERVLPGTAHLEMACAALARSHDVSPTQIALVDVAWLRPLVAADTPREISVTLQADSDGRTSFRIEQVGNDETVLHCLGAVEEWGDARPIPMLDLDALRARCSTNEIAAAELYEAFRVAGMEYGPTHRNIVSLHRGPDEVLARLRVASRADEQSYVLHPGMLDAALQAGVALGWNTGSAAAISGAMAPFSLDTISVFAPCVNELWAWIRTASQEQSRVHRLDLDLCDDGGRVCVSLRGLAARPLERTRQAATTSLYVPTWRDCESGSGKAVPRSVLHRVLWCGGTPAQARAVEAVLPGVVCTGLMLTTDPAEAFSTAALAVLAELHEVIVDHDEPHRIVQVIVPQASVGLEGLAGMLLTAAAEQPDVLGQVLQVPAAAEPTQVAAWLSEARACAPSGLLLRAETGWRIRELAPVSRPSLPELPWKEGGTYWISGGAGGLGLIMAEEILHKVPGARILLNGRRETNPELTARLHALCSRGRVEYYSLDVCDEEALSRWLATVEREGGALTGVVHAAGVLRDSHLADKRDDDLRAVLAPKVRGLITLDRVTQEQPLDFVALFSSLAVFGNPGQSDYAAANAFMDAFAVFRNREVTAGRRYGHTLSINWPLWTEGGMRVDRSVERLMRERHGLEMLDTVSGVTAFYQALACGADHVAVVHGKPRKQVLSEPTSAVTPTAPRNAGTSIDTPPTEPADDALSGRAQSWFVRVLAEALQMPAARMDAHAPFENYGIDSIKVMDLTFALEKHFGRLSRTLFFEYQTTAELTGYFLRRHADVLRRLLAEREPDQPRSESRKKGAPIRVMPGASTQPVATPAREGAFDVAIIGLSGRYPMADSLDQFWRNLSEGRDCISEVPSERWPHAVLFDDARHPQGKSFCRWGGFLDGVADFDPLFFSITPVEATVLDPQERLFLQCAYEVLEDSGYTRDALRRQCEGRIGVYVGVMYEEYPFYGLRAQEQGRAVALTGSPSSIANRVSYFCNFSGPSMAVDSMCSSSLTTLHLACQSLRTGECAAALAGGVNVSIHPNKYFQLEQGHFASSKGRCESFGRGGDGYVPGEGVGAVLLKPLSRAQADGDHIYGVIKATAVNHGGKTNGYTVPNPNAQGAVIAEAMRRCGISSAWISYVEAHGTGTSLGDPIEITGLMQAYEGERLPRGSCPIGSVKSNIGHCESAAGIAGLTKVLMQLRHGRIVPSLHSEALNPNIDFASSPFFVPQTAIEWRRPRREVDGGLRELPRIAGISSFGAGGSNAHVIVQEAPASSSSNAASGPQVIVLSARTAMQRRARAQQLLDHLRHEPDTTARFADIAYTLQTGREPMVARLAFLAKDVADACTKLQLFLDQDEASETLWVGEVTDVLGAPGVVDVPEAPDIRDFESLTRAWVRGADVQWWRLHQQRTRKRVSLPGYPFERSRYWPDFAQVSVTTTPLASAPVALVRGWRPAPLHATAGPSPRLIRVLATAAITPLCTTLAELFAEQRLEVVLHDPEAAGGCDFYSTEAGDVWAAKWQAAHADCATLIDLTAFDPAYEESVALEAGKLRLLQDWLTARARAGGQLVQFTVGLADGRASKPTLRGARLAGLYRMLSAEYPRIRSRSVDFESELDVAEAAARIQAEVLRAPEGDAPDICYREGERYAGTLQSQNLLPAPGRHLNVAGGVALIVGGTGGIGAALAGRLVDQGLRALILLGRDELPLQDQWAQELERATAKRRVKLQRLVALARRGVLLRYANVPLDDVTALRVTLSKLQGEVGRISAVFHCAGAVSDDPAFIRKPIDAIARVVTPKIAGLQALEAVLRDQPLHHFILFSSVSSVVPALAVGQSDYALANSYLDQFARVQRAHGRPEVQALQWPLWSEVGMGAGVEPSAAYRRTGLPSLDSATALDMLERAVELSAAAFLPLPRLPQGLDTEALARAVVGDSRVPNAPQSNPVTASDVMAPAAAVAETDSAARRAEISAWLRGLFVQEFGLPESELSETRSFADYGIDSILMAQITVRMQDRLGRKVDPALLFEHDTLGKLTGAFEHDPAFAASRAEMQRVALSEEVRHAESRAVPGERSTAAEREPESEWVRVSVSSNGASTLDNDVAVVGLACRLPGARNASQLWRLLECGESAIRPLPDGRWDVEFPERYWGGWIDDVHRFDPVFFKLHEQDARVMDPQARLVLEEGLAALCDAGYEHSELAGRRVGVYLGGRSHVRVETLDAVLKAPNPILALGQNYLATNVSRYFDFTGPSLVVDTACSSGITGMAFAVDALRAGRIDMALVGAVSLLQDPLAHDLFAARKILNPDGRFRLFDRQGAGEVLGEGVGVVVIKRLTDALRDADRVYGVIKAIAVNNDGRTLGPGSPNMQAQRQVLREALTQAGVDVADVGYIEVNGGGSPLLDSIEIKVLSEVYRLQDRSLSPCHVGSIKPNLGHLLLGSGIASFIRCVLSVQQRRIPPFLSALDPFEFYDFGASRIVFNRQSVDWPRGARPRCAALSSFADGGTNCHVLVQELDPAYAVSVRREALPLPPMQRRDLSPPRVSVRAASRAGESVERATAAALTTFWGTYVDSEA